MPRGRPKKTIKGEVKASPNLSTERFIIFQRLDEFTKESKSEFGIDIFYIRDTKDDKIVGRMYSKNMAEIIVDCLNLQKRLTPITKERVKGLYDTEIQCQDK